MLQINPRCPVWYTQAANNSSAKWVSPGVEFSLDLQFAEFYIMIFMSRIKSSPVLNFDIVSNLGFRASDLPGLICSISDILSQWFYLV
jgi:hypothetical protein